MVKTLAEQSLSGKRVLLREDLNVPIENGKVTSNARIDAAIPTIKYCIDAGATVIVMSHLGRPKGEVVPALSLDPVAFCLEELLDCEVMFSDDCISEDAIRLSHQMLPGEVHMLENLRFHQGETENDPEFSGHLAQHADIYINDAFGTAHRSHASNVGVPNLITETARGFLMEKEI